jgi:starch synthase
VLLRYDDGLARRIYAGSDLFLMPSRYEPCGLGQMHALRYGSVPVVRRTGGLADTVIDHDERKGTGTGFVFDAYSADALASCMERAVRVFRDRPAWQRIMRAGMRVDFSWERSAREYENVYRSLVNT